MEIQSFILGMGAVLVIIAVVVGVVAFFKVIKLERKLNEKESDIYRTIDNNRKDVDSMVTQLNTQIDKVYGEIDSRYDKLKSVFSKEIENALYSKK
jgi:peptidoglycan hydrolase CwlO-like protein